MIIEGERTVLESKAAAIIAEAIERILRRKPTVVLGIVGGRSVSSIFSQLAEQKVNWQAVHLFMIDERLVPLEHPDSNYGLASPYFNDLITSENRHPFVFKESSAESSVADYDEELRHYGGRFDIILLSSGEDGHVAALFPAHQSINNTKKGFITMNDSPKPPPARMSASRALLSEAEVGLLLFFGESKQHAFGLFQDTGVSVEQCPAKLINTLSQHYIFTDLEVKGDN